MTSCDQAQGASGYYIHSWGHPGQKHPYATTTGPYHPPSPPPPPFLSLHGLTRACQQSKQNNRTACGDSRVRKKRAMVSCLLFEMFPIAHLQREVAWADWLAFMCRQRPPRGLHALSWARCTPLAALPGPSRRPWAFPPAGAPSCWALTSIP